MLHLKGGTHKAPSKTSDNKNKKGSNNYCTSFWLHRQEELHKLDPSDPTTTRTLKHRFESFGSNPKSLQKLEGLDTKWH